MKSKKGLITVLIIVIVIIGFLGYYYFNKQDRNNTLTVNEKNWIESNKNRLIDLSIPSDIPVLSNSGDGVIFDFLADLEKDTGLDFNKISYSNNEKPESDYSIKDVDNMSKKDVLIFKDNYTLVSKNRIKYTATSEINHLSVGVLKDKVDIINKYLDGSEEITYKVYTNTDSMINDVKNGTIDLAAVPKLSNLSSILKSKDLNIAYNITEYTEDYVLSLGNEKTLNKIISKYYKKWSKENFNDSFNKNLVDSYFTIKKTDDQEQAKFRGKRYNYGFVVNSPFDLTTNNGLKGYNHSLLSNFAKATNIELDYKKYSSIDALVKDFGSNKLDIIFDYNSNDKYNMDVYNTVSVFDEKIVIIANQKTNKAINSINSLINETVYTIENSKIDSYLNENGIKTKTFSSVNKLIRHLKKNDIAAIDYYTYDYYIRDDLNNFKNLYTFNLDKDYTFVCRDTSTNKTFNELLNFYLSFENTNQMINDSYKELLEYNTNSKLFRILIAVFSALLIALIGFITSKIIKRHKNPYSKLTKEDKLRYIDNMTSLKNRNYLNDNIDVWESSKVYPQSIIIIDLNNIAYINDNFGHSEGDKVITEGAGILITNQIPNSEIIRTNGNEFLIFVIGQDEKAIITYIRKLHKEFKNISHGFGAAIGYSMIYDEIKTIDDAVNEATIDMRNNKDEDKQA